MTVPMINAHPSEIIVPPTLEDKIFADTLPDVDEKLQQKDSYRALLLEALFAHLEPTNQKKLFGNLYESRARLTALASQVIHEIALDRPIRVDIRFLSYVLTNYQDTAKRNAARWPRLVHPCLTDLEKTSLIHHNEIAVASAVDNCRDLRCINHISGKSDLLDWAECDWKIMKAPVIYSFRLNNVHRFYSHKGDVDVEKLTRAIKSYLQLRHVCHSNLERHACSSNLESASWSLSSLFVTHLPGVIEPTRLKRRDKRCTPARKVVGVRNTVSDLDRTTKETEVPVVAARCEKRRAANSASLSEKKEALKVLMSLSTDDAVKCLSRGRLRQRIDSLFRDVENGGSQ